jgi:hypothetical protein
MSQDERHRGSKLLDKRPLSDLGTPWTHDQYLEMDAQFRGAMLDALERGDEHMPRAS